MSGLFGRTLLAFQCFIKGNERFSLGYHFVNKETLKLSLRPSSTPILSYLNPFVLSYVYIRTKSQNRCDSCTYIWRLWSQNAINAKVKKLSYPHENIDGRQENTIPLPFVLKMRCTRLIYRILQKKWKRDCIFLSIVDVFAGVTQFFHFGLYRVSWPNSSYIYTYTDFAIEIWGFYRRLKDTLRYPHTRCSRASGLLTSISQHVYQVGKRLSLVGVVRCFWRVLENYDCRTKFSSSLGMKYNSDLYGLSDVKVKLVDSLIWRPFIPGWIRPRTPMTRGFDTCANFYFGR